MSYVIYHKETTKLIHGTNRQKTYRTERAAKAARTRFINVTGYNADEYAIAETSDFFNNIEKQVVRRNLMSGEDYLEPVNTPAYMSPACESYWSM